MTENHPSKSSTGRSLSRRRVLQLAGVGGFASVAGCTGGDQQGDTPTSNTSGTSTETPGLQESATISFKSYDITGDTWNVYGGVAPYYTNVLEPLIWVSEDMEKEPWLATDWKRTGEKTFVFTLRDGVTFHNGEPLTADAVVWSFERILNEWAWAPNWIHLSPDGVTKIDDSTVEITTTDVFATFPGAIAHNMVAIQHPDRDREAKEVIGTGPYKVENIEKGQNVEVSAFEDYWRGPPTTAELTYRVIEDSNTRSLALTGHDIEVAFGLPRSKVKSLRNSAKTEVATQLSASAVWIEIHTENAPTDDVRLRKALNYAVSQETIVDSVLDGIGQPARGPVPPTVYWSAHDSLPEYGPNMEKAQRLVEESSYDGETLTFNVNQDEPVDGNLMAQVIQQAASEIGVDIEISVMKPAAYQEASSNDDGHLFLFKAGSNSAAADYIMHSYFKSEEAGSCCSDWYELGEEVDSRIIEGGQTADPEKKTEAYVEAQKLVLEKAAVIPVYYEEYVVGTYTDVDGLDLRPIPEMSRWTELEHRISSE